MAETKTAAELVEDIKSGLATNLSAIEAQAKTYGEQGKKALELAEAVKKQLDELPSGITPEQLDAKAKFFQDQFDELASKQTGNLKAVEKKGISEGLTEAIHKQFSGIKFIEQVDNDLTAELRQGKHIRIHLDNTFDMVASYKNETLAGSLTGNPVATYSTRQAILPAQKINFRDLIPTVNTETGLYVFYRENTGLSNNIAKQLEGSLKAENTYAFTEVKVVQDYLAGYTTFSKQMLTSLPWMQNTLPRLLMRDFFKAENARFFTTVSAAATVQTSIETDNVKKIIDFIAAQMDLNYAPAYGLVSNTDMGALIKSTYTNGYYSGAGGLTLNASGTGVTIFGVPVLPASWVTPKRILTIDNDFLERVQAKGLVIDLSYETDDNFRRNMVTARIECQEEINLLLSPSAGYGTLV